MTQGDCHGSIAFYRLSPRLRRRGLAASVLLVATVLVGCATAPPAKTMDETFAQIRRDQSEIHLFGDFADCLNPPLSEAQKKYLLSGISLYKMQHYARALAVSEREAECQWRAVRICERVSPGECFAQPEGGAQPGG